MLRVAERAAGPEAEAEAEAPRSAEGAGPTETEGTWGSPCSGACALPQPWARGCFTYLVLRNPPGPARSRAPASPRGGCDRPRGHRCRAVKPDTGDSLELVKLGAK